MEIAPDELKRQLQLPAKSLWKGMYSDGLRLGLWTTFHSATNSLSKEIVKKHGFGWLPEKKIWVGPLNKADAMVEELAKLWPEQYSLEAGLRILAKAHAQTEPFWAMAVRPRLREIEPEMMMDERTRLRQMKKGWAFQFPFDPVTIAFLKAFGPDARWSADQQAWIIHRKLDDVTALLEECAIPERHIIVHRLGEPIQMPQAMGGWTPYLVGVDADDIETERVKLQVGGAERPLESSMTPEERAKLKEMERKKEERAALIQRAFHEPMALLDIEDGIVEEIAVRCSLMPHQNDGVRHLARSKLKCNTFGPRRLEVEYGQQVSA
ncbi:hypothetical protein JKG47_04850, partial [Acidithiobacillus sp. MC6.1]|nr:hypothetical protein [Acidithiobacillus sp. MC6.1]